MEIRSRTDSPSLRSATVLETLMTSISSQLTTMSQLQGHFSKQLSAMSQQQSAMSQQQSTMSHQQGSLTVELCADGLLFGGGGGGAGRGGRGGGRGRAKTFFSKIHEKISFYPQNVLRTFSSHQSFEVCR